MMEHDNCYVEPLEKPLDEAALTTAMAAYLAVRRVCETRYSTNPVRSDLW